MSGDAGDGSIAGQQLTTGSGYKLKDFGEQQIADAHAPGLASDQNAAAGYGLESQAEADQSNAEFNNYFAPIESQYGINQDQLTSLFQSNELPSSVNQSLLSGEQDAENALINPDQWYDKLFSELALGTTVGVATAGIGSAIAAPLAGALGSTVGGVATGALSGAAGGALSSALQGQNLGKGALVGAAAGGIGAAASPLVSSLTSSGIPQPVASALVKGGTGAATGALGSELSGGNALAGAEGGAENGALSSSEGSVAGSVFGANNTIFNSGDAAAPISNPGLTNPANPLPNMSTNSDDPFSFLNGNSDDDTPGEGTVLAPNSGTELGSGIDPSQLGIDQSALSSALQNNSSLGDFNQSLTGQNGLPLSLGLSAGGSSGNGSLLSSLASLLGGSSGSGGISSAMLGQLLGLGATTAGGALNTAAAQGAASTYAGETAYNPLSTNTNAGSTQGGNAQLSPQNAMLSQMLGGLAGSSGSALAAGPQAQTTADFNNLQSGSLQAQQRLLGNTQDNEYANGVLGSTAGSYQTQGALNSIGQQTNANYNTATNEAETQQQQQLAQLTQSLTGNQNINNSQLTQIQTGLSGGTAASNANLNAYQPSLYANSNSTFGNALTSLGNSFVNPTTNNG